MVVAIHRSGTDATLVRVTRVVLQLAVWGAFPRAGWTQESALAPAAAVTVTVNVDSSSAWTVTERFLIPPDSTRLPQEMNRRGTFQYLARPCASVDSVVLVGSGRTVPLTVSTSGPWRSLEDPSGLSRVGSLRDGFELRYRVTRDGDDIDVPLILPTHSIATGGGSQQGSVEVLVRLPNANGEVAFPRLARDDNKRHWRARLVAIPSFVNIRLSSEAMRCGRALPVGDDGGLTWRFWLLVAILVTWVPTYQWWARRRTRDDA